MTYGPTPLCLTCKRLTGEQVCEAFPNGIPDAIYWGGYNHRNSYPGDNGLRYLPKPKSALKSRMATTLAERVRQKVEANEIRGEPQR